MKKALILIAMIAGVALAWATPPDRLPSLLTPPAEARTVVVVGGSSPASGACTDANPVGTCTGFLLCQNYQTATSGYDNSEDWQEVAAGAGCTVEAAYSTGPLRGTQSLYLNDGNDACASYIGISRTGDVYFFARVKFISLPDSTSGFIIFTNSSFSTIFKVSIQSSGVMIVEAGGDPAYGTNSLVEGETYNIWAYYSPGTGANAVGWVRYAAATTYARPGTNEAGTTSGTSTENVSYVSLNAASGTGIEVMFDQVLVDDAVIGTICP